MKAFIFAAGLGTRLKPLTDTKPKALVPIGGKVLIDYLVDKLLLSSCDEIIVNVHHFADQILEHFAQRNLSIPVKFSDETDMLRETGGAIKHAVAMLGEEPFVVHNSDVISNVDIEAMYAAFEQDNMAMLLVSERATSRYLIFDENDLLVGWTNVVTGEVKTPYADLELERCKKLAFAGVHIISPEIVKLMDDMPEKFSIIDFYLKYADKCKIKAYVQDGLRMVDVGKFDTLIEIENEVKEIVR